MVMEGLGQPDTLSTWLLWHLSKHNGLPHGLPFVSAEVCGALNVTVSPGPVVDYLEGENATLLCHVSQKRRKDSLLAVRWFLARPDAQEALMVKMTKLRAVQYYGNFSRSSYRHRLRLLEERRGVLYTLSILALGPADQGHYVCKVQEISKHKNKWTAWSNGSSETEMRGKHVCSLGGGVGSCQWSSPQRARQASRGSAGLEHTISASQGHSHGHGHVSQVMG